MNLLLVGYRYSGMERVRGRVCSLALWISMEGLLSRLKCEEEDEEQLIVVLMVVMKAMSGI